MPTATLTYPYVELAEKYVGAVLDGEVPACEFVRQACERQRRDLERWDGVKGAPFYFDEKAANRVCDIISRFPHIKGVKAQERRKLELEPWQCFILSTVFGWMATASRTRRFRIAYIEVPRKNGKSSITSAVGLYMAACDGEAGAYVVSAANSRDQAKLVFVDAQNMARREPGFRSKFGVQVMAHVIAVPDTASKFEALSAEHSNLDGLNLHAALIDELHAHPTRGLWDVLETATGSRSQPLIWAITTAGNNRGSVCYDQRTHVLNILNGRVEDESYFGIVYTIDAGDDPYTEEAQIKANPNFGISVYPEPLRHEAKRAQLMPSAQAAYLTKHLNVWINASIAWLPSGAWERCQDPELELEDFAHEACYIGLDLARRSDLTAMMICFPPAGRREWWAVFGRYYLPEQTITRSENTHYQGWESIGRLVSTTGVITDFDYIIDDLSDLASRFHVQEIVFDPHDAAPVYASLEKRGITVPKVDVKQSAANMSPAMIEMEGLVLSRKIRHDGDPVLAWMVSNVLCKRGNGDLMQPDKEADNKKIDGVTALLMCINRAVRRDQPAAAGVRVISMEDDD